MLNEGNDMEKISEGFDILKAQGNGLSITDVITILQKVDNSDTLNSIEGISDDEMKKDRQYYLSLHPYEIYFSETEQRWRTQIPDVTKKSGRRDIKRKKKTDLENFIVDYYKKSETASDTFTALYYDWLLTYKVLEASKATIERLHTSFRTYYAKSTLADKPIKQITPIMLKTFLM